jgi:hypothetical protein
MTVVVLAGGTGGAKLARGMLDVTDDLVAVVNTGDDVEIHGAHVSPDPDLVTFWLADVIDERGWGLHDDTFIVLDSHGDIGASAGGPDGLFNADTRYLARLEMVLDEVQPLLLGSNLRDDNSALTVDLTNSDVYRNGRLVLQKDTLHIVRSIFLWRGTAYQRIALQNHGDLPASFDLTLLFDNDFADFFADDVELSSSGLQSGFSWHALYCMGERLASGEGPEQNFRRG